VERFDWMFRFLEKVQYKEQQRRTLVRFVVLRLDEVWSHGMAPNPKVTEPTESAGSRKTRLHAGGGSPQVA
jgi:hypothetical protein